MSNLSLQGKEIFLRALEVSGDDRDELLDRECSDDPQLRQFVELLLGAFEEADDFLSKPLFGSSGPEGTQSTRGEQEEEETDILRAHFLPHSPWGGTTTIGPTLSSGPSQFPQIPGYEILGELGRGGMGVVYQARQLQADRIVALKMILSEQLADEETRERFRLEAQAIAQLQHPGIIQIFDVGEHESRPYFSMELCSYGSLSEYLAGAPITPRQAAELTRDLAQAVEAAHKAKVIHRDIKPANVLLTNRPGEPRSSEPQRLEEDLRPPLPILTPKVTDFGLVRRLDDAGHTRTGMIMGTPSYMSPEQASGDRHIGVTTDVYSLGALLYECLTARPPFKAASGIETLVLVTREEPVAPRRLQPNVPLDLETICLKCLEKDAAKRYESAQALADDLDRFLNNEPIQARAVGALERTRKWVLRHPVVSTLIAAVVLAVVVGTAAATWFALQANARAKESHENEQLAIRNAKTAKEAAALAEHRENDARLAQHNTRIAKLAADKAAALAKQKQKEAQAAQEREKKLRMALETRASALRIQLVNREWASGNWLRAQEALDRIPGHQRGWVFRHLRHRLNAEPVLLGHPPREANNITALTFAPNGRFLASGDSRGTVKLWDMESRREVITLENSWGVALNAKGDLLATADLQGDIQFWRVPQGDKLHKIDTEGQQQPVLGFSPDGKMIASGGLNGSLKVWDARTGKMIHSLGRHDRTVRQLLFRPDSKKLASTDDNGTIKLWNLNTGKSEHLRIKESLPRVPVQFDSKGNLLCWRKGMVLLDAKTGRYRARVEKFESPAAATFSPENKLLALVQGARLHLFQLGRTRPFRTIPVPVGEVTAMAISSDGNWFATADHNKIRLWPRSQRAYRKVAVPPFRSLLWDPTSSQFILRSPLRRELWVWNPETPAKKKTLTTQARGMNDVAISPSGKRLLTGGIDKKVTVWDLATLKAAITLEGHKATVRRVLPSGDDRYVASVDDQQRLIIWDTKNREQKASYQVADSRRLACADPSRSRFAFVAKRATPVKSSTLVIYDCRNSATKSFVVPGQPRSLHIDPTGKRLALVFPGKVEVLTISTGKKQQFSLKRRFENVVFSPEGNYLAGIGDQKQIALLNLKTGEVVTDTDRTDSTVSQLLFLPGEKRLVSLESDGRIVFRDLQNLEPTFFLEYPADRKRGRPGIGLINRGRQLVWYGDKQLRVWSAGEQFDHYRFAHATLHFSCMALRPDAKQIATNCCGRGIVTLLDVETGKSIRSVGGTGAWGQEIDFSPDGSVVAIARQTRVEILRSKTGELVRSLPAKDEKVTSVAFAPDGKTIAVGQRGGKIVVWNVTSGKPVFHIETKLGMPRKLVYSADGKRLGATLTKGRSAHGVYYDTCAIVWDLATKKELTVYKREKRPVHDIDLSRDGRKMALAIGTGKGKGNAGSVRIWGVENKKLLREFKPHGGKVRSVDFGPNDKRLLTAGGDLAVRIWNTKTLKETFVFHGHENDVTEAVFDAKGEWILTRSLDWTCNLLRVTGRRHWTHPAGNPDRRNYNTRR